MATSYAFNITSVTVRSSHQRRSIEIGVRKNFTKFTGKHLCMSLFFNKVAGLRPSGLQIYYNETPTQVFSCEYCQIFKNSFFNRTPLVAASS